MDLARPLYRQNHLTPVPMPAAAPYMKIFEQPAGTSFRFRYESEGRFSGSIQGVNSTAENPSFPKIEIGNYTGNVIVLVSCVTQHKPYKQHPHKISSKNVVEKGGVHCVKRTIHQSGVIEFNDIGVISVKKNAIDDSLKARNKCRVDPTGGGWNHIGKPQLMDLQSVRLCFQVLMLSGADERIRTPLGYEVSNPIMDKRSNGQPKIAEISSTMSSVMGGERIILLCDKVKREDISIVFYECDNDGKVIWREEINYQNQSGLRVHHQHAISFLTPTYKELDIRQARQTFLQLFRPSDKKESDPLDFEFTPNEQSNVSMIRKKHKNVNESLKETLNSNHSRKREVKPRKTKHEPSIQGQMNILLESNRNNIAVQRENPQPAMKLDENDGENVPVPYPMINQRQNINQATAGNAVASDYGQFAGTSGRHNDYPAYCYAQQHNGTIDQQHTPYHARPLNLPTACQPQIKEQQPIAAPIYPNIYAADTYAMYSNRPAIPNADHSMNSVMNSSPSYMYHLPYNNNMNLPDKPSEYYLDIDRVTNIHSETNGMNISELAQKNSADLMKIFDTEGFIGDTFCDAFRKSIELSKQTTEN